MADELDPEVVAKIASDVEKLDQIWNKMVEMVNSVDAKHFHAPPAIETMINGYMEDTAERAREASNFSDAAVFSMKNNYNLYLWMFLLGNMAAQEGIRYEDLTPCTCGQITDADLVKLLESGPASNE